MTERWTVYGGMMGPDTFEDFGAAVAFLLSLWNDPWARPPFRLVRTLRGG